MSLYDTLTLPEVVSNNNNNNPSTSNNSINNNTMNSSLLTNNSFDSLNTNITTNNNCIDMNNIMMIGSEPQEEEIPDDTFNQHYFEIMLQQRNYKVIRVRGEGTFSKVLEAKHLKTNQRVAIKCMKSKFKDKDKVNRLREIQALKLLSPNENIITLIEVIYDSKYGYLALVFELMEYNIYEVIKKRKKYFNEYQMKYYMYQILKGIEHMHKHNIFHRDIKPENILVNKNLINNINNLENEIMYPIIKLADFGSCQGTKSKKPYTEYISTRWYRAPECLLTDGFYDCKMDLWSIGCVMYEMITFEPLFPGENELDQIHLIHKVIGTPNEEILNKFRKHASRYLLNGKFPKRLGKGLKSLIPNVSKDCLDLLTKLLTYNPDERITAAKALKHAFFKEIDPTIGFNNSGNITTTIPNAMPHSSGSSNNSVVGTLPSTINNNNITATGMNNTTITPSLLSPSMYSGHNSNGTSNNNSGGVLLPTIFHTNNNHLKQKKKIKTINVGPYVNDKPPPLQKKVHYMITTNI
ncbi:hypothetical protein ABK040_014011 [Willaertia magna]